VSTAKTKPRAKKAPEAKTARPSKATRTASVEDSMARLDAPWHTEVSALRAAIVRSNRAITEQLKWNAPSFCYEGDDRVTFRFPPRGGVQLIFHRGVKVKDASGFSFEDPTGLISWAAPDRGVISFGAPADMRAAKPSVVKLVNAWMKATA
jgi:hypothetical protein